MSVDPDTPEEVARALEARVEMLYGSGRLDELWREISDTAFLDEARAHAAVAGPALRAVGLLAWHVPDAGNVHQILRHVSVQHGHGQRVYLVDGEIALAFRFFQLLAAAKLEVPVALVRVFVSHALVTPATRTRAWRELAALFDDPLPLLRTCDRLAQRDPPFAQVMIARLSPEAPPDRGAMELLPLDVVEALRHALLAIPRRSVWRKLSDTVKDAANFAGDHPVLNAFGFSKPAPPREYTEHARPAVARILWDLGIGAPVALTSITTHRRRLGPVARYEKIFQGDVALLLYGVLATIARAAK